ncbi:MAG TPA: SRPBCC family protein, partial [Solirubrobacteraceae bacterium]|nr:SRPBCC family protein [Solirubrobacteraceae bacterium]
MGRMGGTASAEIDAPIDEVWAVVEDVLTAPEWQGGLVSMSALERDGEGRATLVETENDIKVRHVKTEVRFQ